MTEQQCEENRKRFEAKAAQWDLDPARVSMANVLLRLRPALRSGGWIALADLDTEDGSFHSDMTGVYYCGFERATVCRWLEQAGFTETASRESHRMVRPDADGILRTYPIFLVTARAG